MGLELPFTNPFVPFANVVVVSRRCNGPNMFFLHENALQRRGVSYWLDLESKIGSYINFITPPPLFF